VKQKRLTGPLACLAVVALVAAACSSSSNSSSSTSSTSTTAATSTSAASTSGGGETVGITPTTVTVGNVSILSGPVPGLFQGAPYGVQAFFAYQNSLGGVNGRKLQVVSDDDGFSCTNNQSETQQLTQSVFAMVGSFSLYDNCGAKALKNVPNMPDVSYSLDPVAQALPNNFSPQPLRQGFRTGPYEYYKQHYPNAIKCVGSLVSNVASSVASWNGQKAAMQSVGGYHICYEREVSPLETDFTSDILRMKQAGVQFLTMTNLDVQIAADILNEAQQQGWRPQVIQSGGIAYDASFFKLVHPGAGNGLLNDQQQALYLGQDASTTPEVQLFDTWIKRTHPNFAPDIFSVFAWASARLFVQALQAAGPNPTRSSVMAALRNIHSFDSNGLLATSDPASKVPPTCWVLIKVTDTSSTRSYSRFDSPSKGFRCSPDGYFYQH
jgi:ABC-type branched-subunit amino acid transport system substrate-binding protein